MEMLKEPNGKFSSKRFITIVAFVLMSTAFVANLFWDYAIDPIIYDSMKWIVIGGMGFVVGEKFGKQAGSSTGV